MSMNSEEAKKILGINGGLTPEIIQRAFRKMAQQYHPDRYQTLIQQAWATRKFIKIKEAHDLLIEGIAFDGINESVFQEEDFFHKDAKPTAPTLKDLTDLLNSMYGGDSREEFEGIRVEHSVASFALFRLVNSLFEWGGKRGGLYGFITLLVMLFSFPLLIYYFIVISILTGIFTASGIGAYSDSRTKQGRFAYLLIITLASAPFFILPWYFFMYHYEDFQQFINNGLRVCFVGLFLLAIYLSVLSEWVGFFLAEIWRRSIEDDLRIFLPVIKQK